MNRFFPLLIVTGFLAGLAGCQTTGGEGKKEGEGAAAGAGEEAVYVARVDSAPFYRYGPAQAGEPDWVLKRGERVTMVRLGKGYSQARLPSGMAGWVATGDFEPLEGSRLAGEGDGADGRGAGRVSGEEEFVPPVDPARELPMPEPVAPPPGLPEFRI